MGPLRRTGCVLLAALALVASPVPVGAASEPAPSPERREAIQDELAVLEESLDDVAAEEEAIQGDLELTQERRRQLDEEASALADELGAARATLARTESHLDGAIAEHLRTQERLAAARRELVSARRRLQRQAIDAFVTMGSPTAELDVYLGAADLRELNGARVMVDAVVDSQLQVVERYAELRDVSARLDDEAVEARAEADRRRREVVAQNAAVERLHAEVRTAQAAVDEQATREQGLLDETRTRKSQFETRIVALKQESDSITSLLQERQTGQLPASSGGGVLSSPLANPRVTSRFGYRVHPIFGTRRLHAGIDYGAPTGTPILAAADGLVAFAGVRGGYGNAVVLDHGNSLATLYGHQSRIAVAPGSRVVRGQVIGYVGSTGFATGPHLHFEVRVSGTPVDPAGYL